MPDAKPSELIMELYNRGELSERQQAIISQAQQTGKLQDLLNAMDSRAMRAQTPAQPAQAAKPAQPEPGEKLGILDYLAGTGEMAGMVGSGAASEFIAPIPAIMATVGMGDIEAYPEIYNRIKEILTYTPKSKGATAQAQWLGEKVGPAMQTAQETWKGVSDIAAEKGGPIAGTAAAITPAALIELLGLGGTRAAKKAMLSRTMKGLRPTELIDEAGELLPQIRNGIERAGLSADDFEEVVRDAYRTTESTMQPIVEQIAKAGKKPSESIIEAVKPNKEIMDAAREFGMQDDLLLSHVSDNPTYRAVEQGLKSMPGSQLDAKEIKAIEKLANQADDLIKEFGGTTDKAALSDKFRSNTMEVINRLDDEASALYSDVKNIIPRDTPVQTDKTLEIIKQAADELGGAEYLTPAESKLLSQLNPESNPTYARLDKLRKEIGATMRGKGDTFKNSDEGLLKRLYGALANDQQAAAKAISPEAGERYLAANRLTATRKGMEEQLKQTLGKDLSGSVARQAGLAMRDLQTGNPKNFDKLMKNIPEQLGKESRKEIVATALNDAFVQGSRKEKQLNIAGFDDFMSGIKRNEASYKRLEAELGSDAMKRLDSFHSIVKGVRRAKSKEISTGLIAGVPNMFDEMKGIAEKVYGVGETIGKKTGVRPPELFERILTPKTKRSVTADELLSSPQFRKFVEKKLAGQLDTAQKIKKAEKVVERLKAYEKWKNTLGKNDLRELAAVGIAGYFTSPKEEEREGLKALEEAKQYRQRKEYEQAMAQEK